MNVVSCGRGFKSLRKVSLGVLLAILLLLPVVSRSQPASATCSPFQRSSTASVPHRCCSFPGSNSTGAYLVSL